MKKKCKKQPRSKEQLLFQRRCDEVAAKNTTAFLKGDLTLDDLIAQVIPKHLKKNEKEKE